LKVTYEPGASSYQMSRVTLVMTVKLEGKGFSGV
jgi:hypothetical protein